MASIVKTEVDWCPNCGEGVESLNPFTGFCDSCSPGYCVNCGKKFTPYQTSRITCNDCRRVEWLSRNADAIEKEMARGYTVIVAIVRVSNLNRPKCVVCGDDIKYGTQGRTIFCGKRDSCRRASIRFHRYRKRGGMSYDAALQKVLEGIRTDSVPTSKTVVYP